MINYQTIDFNYIYGIILFISRCSLWL